MDKTASRFSSKMDTALGKRPKSQRYDPLAQASSSAHSDADSDASTEIGDEEEDGWDPERGLQASGHGREKGKTAVRAIKSQLWMLNTVLLLAILLLLLLSLFMGSEQGEMGFKTASSSSRFELLGDVSGFTPSFSSKVVTFRPDARFAPEKAEAFFSNETLEAWLGIVPAGHLYSTCLNSYLPNCFSSRFFPHTMPLVHTSTLIRPQTTVTPVLPPLTSLPSPTAGLGYTEITDPQNHHPLPHPIHDYPSKSVFTTSLTHQLHCLYTILSAYNAQTVALSSFTSSSSSSPRVPPVKEPWHITHCAEYLRQAIMCGADVALEGAATTFPEGEFGDRGGSDGWDGRHVCRDYGEVMGWLEGVAVSDVKLQTRPLRPLALISIPSRLHASVDKYDGEEEEEEEEEGEHRRKDLYGPDADKYDPERWATLRPSWEYLPFNGGPRICLGQQYALTEASYVTVRMLQEFKAMESRDAEPWIEGLTLTLCSKNGVKVGLTPA
ncbi:hypothetical protein LEMA_P073080.1 [Plenodomus lingam JN3]|uniref:Cytochrome P450 n=1 Tax=Leptosphaeria maculans (strain JN3 / isolate v23.1.3 / race Av1-4-5-6-7-8) TaxID=985895 RepID=E5A7X4_LEPMJ|nr:hypothetical protein LEMA_P073080.1 [Plenodomus lingam JN3]CBX99719.1 hypothetical protein LEMA_P073080.1 [Plenodomus lingam JN3]